MIGLWFLKNIAPVTIRKGLVVPETRELLDLLENHFRLDRILADTQTIYDHDRSSSFDGYRRTADFMETTFRDLGLEVERIGIPCDGKFAFGDWVMPFAWDAEEGTLEILDDDGNPQLKLADYRQVPNNLWRWCRPTAAEGEVRPLCVAAKGART